MGENGEFKFEDCLLKHYVRQELWLPNARARKKSVEAVKPQRRLKYLTFCAPGALDVLMLDLKKIIRRSAEGEFDTVYFFNRSTSGVTETRKRIPGARGFAVDFVKIVAPENETGDEDEEDDDPLANPEADANTTEVRGAQRSKAAHQSIKAAFPFDLINLDLEQYIFRPKEVVPGKLIAALSRVLEWQKRKGAANGKSYEVEEFTLLFTTRVGPTGLSDDYVEYLRDRCLQKNLDDHPELKEPFVKRSGGKDVAAFFAEDFEAAFKIAAPKSLIELAMDHDWHIVGSAKGVEVYEFDRQTAEGDSYTMLHMAMTVRRHNPKKPKRLPGSGTPKGAVDEHQASIRKLFEESPVVVGPIEGDLEKELQGDLNKLFDHRKKFYSED